MHLLSREVESIRLPVPGETIDVELLTKAHDSRVSGKLPNYTVCPDFRPSFPSSQIFPVPEDMW